MLVHAPIVFDGMAFFLPAVVVFLLRLTFQAANRPLGAIDDKCQVGAYLQNLGHILCSAFR